MRDTAAVETSRTSDQDKAATDRAATDKATGRDPQKAAMQPGTNREPGKPATEPGTNREPGKPATEPGTNREPGKPATTSHATDRDPGKPVTGHTTTATAAATAAEPAPGADVPGRLGRRMEHAIGGFVDDPRRAVREADDVLEEAIKHLARVVENRRTALRTGCKDGADTEELRVALTRYRDLTGRLLAL